MAGPINTLMNNTGRKAVKGTKTSAPMVIKASTAAKGTPATASSMTAAKAGPTRDEIARRSYEIFLARGGTHGHDMEDWVQAEHDLGL
jgi:Protein of unknown function (DUF2934)